MEDKSKNTTTFFAPGKLMISGEYMVLRGALALAIPLKYGQQLQVSTGQGGDQFKWVSLKNGEIWFSARFDKTGLKVLETNNREISDRLQNILTETRKLNPDFLKDSELDTVTTKLDFKPEWGIGASSSLIVNISRWANVDPFVLNQRIFGGSGCDIATGLSAKPVLYRLEKGKPVFEAVDFSPSFHENLYFIYQNRKQDSQTAIKNFESAIVTPEKISFISDITRKIVISKSYDEFIWLIENHEFVLAETLRKAPIQQLHFADFKGTIKSLGAWGGDFMMAASQKPAAYVKGYFSRKGYKTIFRWQEMVKE